MVFILVEAPRCIVRGFLFGIILNISSNCLLSNSIVIILIYFYNNCYSYYNYL